MGMVASVLLKSRPNYVFNPQSISEKTFHNMFVSSSFVNSIQSSFGHSEFNIPSSKWKFSFQPVFQPVFQPLSRWQHKQEAITNLVKRFFSLDVEVLEFPSKNKILKFLKTHPSTEPFFGTPRETILITVAEILGGTYKTKGEVSKELISILYSIEEKESLKEWDDIFTKIITALKDCVAEDLHLKQR